MFRGEWRVRRMFWRFFDRGGMEVIGKGGGMGIICVDFFTIIMLLFQIFVQLILIRCEGVHHHPRLR